MLDRITNGLKLLQASWHVLRADRELLVLPVLSLLSSIGLAGLTFAWLFADDVRALRAGQEALTPSGFEWVVLAILGYALTYVTIFFNVALVCAADERMRGGDPTVAGALRDASTHARAIAPWAAVTVLASMVLRAIEERGGVLGRIAAGALGIAWTLITYLVLPVLVLEGLTVRKAIARSKDLFARTWGETVSGQLGLSVIGFLAALVALPFLLFVGGGGQPGLVVTAIALGILWLVAVSVVLGALGMVFRVALYRYAADGEPPEGFAHLDLGHIFPERRGGALGHA